MTLRRHNILLLLAAVASLLVSSCVDDFFDDERRGPAPGSPVELTLGLSIPQPTPAVSNTSRANPSTEINRQVYDLFLFFFDEEEGETKGRLKSKFYFSSISAGQYSQCDPVLSSNSSAQIERTSLGSGHIRHIHTTSGRTRIVGLANISVKGSANILQQLTQITTFDELQAIMVSTIDRQSGLPDIESELSVMSGFYCEDTSHSGANEYSPCVASSDNHNGLVDVVSAELPGKVWLTPLQAKVRFVVDGNGTLGGKFELQSWQAYNLPGQTPLICPGSTTKTDINPTRSRLNTVIYPYEPQGDETLFGNDTIDAEHVFAFAFFPADNHPGTPTHEITSYADRAAWSGWENHTGTVEPDRKEYTNAPANATYVVLRGHYSGKSLITEGNGSEPVEKDVDADVTYTVFLGHNSATDFNDFNTHRNTNYTYVVRVKGVNQISVEVNTGHDRRPDAEGNVSVIDSRTEVLDCHFEQRVIHISRRQVLDAIANHTFRVIVDEPVFGIQQATYNFFRTDDAGNSVIAGDYDPENALQYMNWAEFYRHTPDEAGRTYIPYTRPKHNNQLKDVRGFMDDLYDFASSGTDDEEEAIYTIYFNEYVYIDESNGQEVISWKRLVNQYSCRSLTLLGSTKFSDDHNSSYSTAGTRFEQMQMQTIYNPDAPGLERAWAVENIEENIVLHNNNRYPYIPYEYYSGRVNRSDNTRYGRQNCWRAFASNNGNPFSNFVDTITGLIVKQSNGNSIYTECMNRNRDVNGNGEIDKEEMRWYIPSIEQYQLLYIGRAGLSPETQLYNPAVEAENFFIHNGNRTYPFKHYMSSSNQKMWSEEGCSTSSMAFNSNGVANRVSRIYIRCVRDLGTDAYRSPEVPWNIYDNNHMNDAMCVNSRFQSIYTLEEGAANTGSEDIAARIHLTFLNNSATRTTAEMRERPGSVTTFSTSNSPFHIIEVADTIFQGVNMPNYFAAVEGELIGDTKCHELGQGWRLPTITEVAVMKWAKGSLIPNATASRTRSYFQAAGIHQDGWWGLPGWCHFLNNYGNFSLSNLGNERVRCVRDYTGHNIDDDDDNTNDTPSVGNKPARRARRVRR